MPVPHPTLSAREQLVDSINRLYQVRLLPEQVQFGVPELIDGSVTDIEEPTARNSRVQIRDANGEPYEFTSALHFNRLSLETLFLRRDKNFAGEIIHTFDLLPQIIERLGFQVTEEDIVGHEIELGGGYPASVLLVAAETSLLLYGEVNVFLTGPEQPND